MALLSNMLPPNGVVTPDGIQTLTNKTLTAPTINTPTLNNGQANTLTLANPTVSTSLDFSGTGLRIRGDLSNATLSNRLAFQSNTTNGNSTVTVLPNGTATVSQFAAYSASSPDNTAFLAFQSNGVTNQILSNKTGTGSALPLLFMMDGTERVRIDTSGNVGIGKAPSYNLDVFGSTTGAVVVGGATGRGIFQTETGAADAAGITVGTVEFRGGASTAGSADSRAALIVVGTEGATATQRGGYLAFNTKPNGGNQIERLRIDSNGDVGIGAIPSGVRLEVRKSDASGVTAGIGLVNDESGSGVSIVAAGTTFSNSGWLNLTDALHIRATVSGANGMAIYTGSASPLRLGTGTAERLQITGAGDVLVTGSGGLGYGTGSGGQVTQATSKSTTVTLNKPCGTITMNAATLNAGASVTFDLNNTVINPLGLASDNMVVAPYNNAGYRVEVAAMFGSAARIRVTNVTGSNLSEALVISFAVLKGATS